MFICFQGNRARQLTKGQILMQKRKSLLTLYSHRSMTPHCSGDKEPTAWLTRILRPDSQIVQPHLQCSLLSPSGQPPWSPSSLTLTILSSTPGPLPMPVPLLGLSSCCLYLVASYSSFQSRLSPHFLQGSPEPSPSPRLGQHLAESLNSTMYLCSVAVLHLLILFSHWNTNF